MLYRNVMSVRQAAVVTLSVQESRTGLEPVAAQVHGLGRKSAFTVDLRAIFIMFVCKWDIIPLQLC